MNRAEIEAAIPHREPFLFVDHVVGRSATSLESEWTVPADADWFRGHYPGQPVLPGVLMSEHVFQSAALFVSGALSGFDHEVGIPVLTKIEAARFRRVVRPGETLRTQVKLEERVGPAWFLSGRVMCGDEVALKIRFVLSATGAMHRVLNAEG